MPHTLSQNCIYALALLLKLGLKKTFSYNSTSKVYSVLKFTDTGFEEAIILCEQVVCIHFAVIKPHPSFIIFRGGGGGTDILLDIFGHHLHL